MTFSDCLVELHGTANRSPSFIERAAELVPINGCNGPVGEESYKTKSPHHISRPLQTAANTTCLESGV